MSVKVLLRVELPTTCTVSEAQWSISVSWTVRYVTVPISVVALTSTLYAPESWALVGTTYTKLVSSSSVNIDDS